MCGEEPQAHAAGRTHLRISRGVCIGVAAGGCNHEAVPMPLTGPKGLGQGQRATARGRERSYARVGCDNGDCETLIPHMAIILV